MAQVTGGQYLPIFLDTAVPLWILRLWQRGGATAADLQRVKSYSESFFSDESLLYRTKPGQTATAFNKLAEAVAVLSFIPGGVTLFDRHWEAGHWRTLLGTEAGDVHDDAL